jgi:molecular chaperone GrpE
MTGRKKAAPGTKDESQEFEAQLEQEGFAVEENAPAAATDMEAQLEAARQEATEAKDQMLRYAAECDNFKKRLERERCNSLMFAEECIIRELLPTIDNLERALDQGKTTQDSATLLEGVEMTRKGLVVTLEKFGLRALAAVGQPFDPNIHEALATGVSDTVPVNHVMQEYEKGYLFKDRLLRAAKVVVAKQEEC